MTHAGARRRSDQGTLGPRLRRRPCPVAFDHTTSLDAARDPSVTLVARTHKRDVYGGDVEMMSG